MLKPLTVDGRELSIYHEVVDGKDCIIFAERRDADGGVVTNVVVPDDAGTATYNLRTWRGSGRGEKAVFADASFDPPLWDEATVYARDAPVKDATGMVWRSRLGENTGNPPVAGAAWRQAMTPITDADMQAGQAEALAVFSGMTAEEVALRARVAILTRAVPHQSDIEQILATERARLTAGG